MKPYKRFGYLNVRFVFTLRILVHGKVTSPARSAIISSSNKPTHFWDRNARSVEVDLPTALRTAFSIHEVNGFQYSTSVERWSFPLPPPGLKSRTWNAYLLKGKDDITRFRTIKRWLRVENKHVDSTWLRKTWTETSGWSASYIIIIFIIPIYFP